MFEQFVALLRARGFLAQLTRLVLGHVTRLPPSA